MVFRAHADVEDSPAVSVFHDQVQRRVPAGPFFRRLCQDVELDGELLGQIFLLFHEGLDPGRFHPDGLGALDIHHLDFTAVQQIPLGGEFAHPLAAQVVLEEHVRAALEIALGLDLGEIDLFGRHLGLFDVLIPGGILVFLLAVESVVDALFDLVADVVLDGLLGPFAQTAQDALGGRGPAYEREDRHGKDVLLHNFGFSFQFCNTNLAVTRQKNTTLKGRNRGIYPLFCLYLCYETPNPSSCIAGTYCHPRPFL